VTPGSASSPHHPRPAPNPPPQTALLRCRSASASARPPCGVGGAGARGADGEGVGLTMCVARESFGWRRSGSTETQLRSDRYVRKWTAHLQQQWQFGRSRFMEGLPMNDTLIKYTTEKFETCAAVGNSGGLLRARAGQVRHHPVEAHVPTPNPPSLHRQRHTAAGPPRNSTHALLPEEAPFEQQSSRRPRVKQLRRSGEGRTGAR
jgi:hypothetical protein